MLTVLSPAKKLSKKCSASTSIFTEPIFLDQSQELIKILKKKSPEDLQALMGISESLSKLNWERFQSWKLPLNKKDSREAIFSFEGDTYTGINAIDLNEKDIVFAQNHTRILSGLYGVLRPLDLILPYRLEMGTRLMNKQGKDLYYFWGDKIVKAISKELDSHDKKILINCASVEYFKSLNHGSFDIKVITPHFKEMKNGQYKIISFFAKKARGMMARYIIKNQIKDHKSILQFDYAGYKYNSDLSTLDEPVFTRAQS
tara:strand:- start:430 stop:1203 length:774 start_codon:yes stop_codon:yes gene_type:complete